MTQSTQGVRPITSTKTASGRGVGQIILVARVVVLPELGGKIISLIRIASGCEYLISLPSNEDFRKPSFGGTFVDYNNVGFDECIPTIAACDYPEGTFAGFQLPDHGDVWSLPWQHEIRDTGVMLSVEGALFRSCFGNTSACKVLRCRSNTSCEIRVILDFSFFGQRIPCLQLNPVRPSCFRSTRASCSSTER
jgi:hypothetical protein